MTLDQLRLFAAVAERLHFTRAAHALGLTQSAVSAAVAALEARHGVSLFHRIGRHVELTAEGTAFLAEAHLVLRAAARAQATLDELSGLARGRLMVQGSQTIANYWLPPRLHRFRAAHPGINVDLSIGNSTQVAAAVAAGAAELGFVEGAAATPGLDTRAVADDTMVLIAPPAAPWAAALAAGLPTALTATPWVVREPGSGTRAALEALASAHGVPFDALPVALELPSNEAVCAAVEAGAGATIVSILVAGRGLQAGTLARVPWPLPTRRFTLLTHPDRRPSRAAAAFLAGL